MLDVIQESMLVAARFGAQLGVQLQFDKEIGEWQRFCSAVQNELHLAKNKNEKLLALSRRYEEEILERDEKIKFLEKKIEAKENESALLKDGVKNLKSHVATQKKILNNHNEKIKIQIKKSKSELDSVVSENKSIVINLLKELTKKNRYLLATRARLVGAERLYGCLVSEILENNEVRRYYSLKDEIRKRVLITSWNQIVDANTKYNPSLQFSYDSLPFFTM